MNDELTLNDVKYISVKRAAEITQYSRDYIGQLCRKGKVLASRIGRNWYVAEKSIVRHKTENGTKTSFAPHIETGKNTNVRLLDSLSKKEEGKPQSSLRSRESVYSEPARHWPKPQAMAGGPLVTYYSDDRPVLPQLQREKMEVLKKSTPKDDENTVRINIVDSHVNLPTKYVDKKPVLGNSLSLEGALIVIIFIAVSLGLFVVSADYMQATRSGESMLFGGSALAAFNQTAELVSVTIDDTIYNYLYASLFDD